MKYATLLAVALALQAAMGSVQAAAGAERIVAAREALRTGNRSQLDALVAEVVGHAESLRKAARRSGRTRATRP